MTYKQKIIITITITLGFILLNVIHHHHILPRFLIKPSIDSIAEKFVEAIVGNDKQLALTLTENSKSCQGNMLRSLDKLISDSEGFNIKDSNISLNAYAFDNKPEDEYVHILVPFYNPKGSDDGLNFTIVTTYSVLGRRYTCGIAFIDEGY